jgi:hypothetical protein
VVDGRIVLVDGLLDHPEAERAGVELDVARRVPVMAVMWWMPSSFTSLSSSEVVA